MEKKKIKLSEEIKKELRESSALIKEEDLHVDEAVVDKYTRHVFNRYKSGLVKNKWFIWSGALSIVFGVLAVFSMAVLTIIFAVRSDLLVGKQSDYDIVRNRVLISVVVITLVGIISVFVGCKIKSYSNYKKEKLIENVVSISFVCFLQFLFGGILTVILSFIGYFVGIGTDYGAIYYSRIDNPSSLSRRLADAKRLYQRGELTQKEYEALKQSILRDGDLE